MPYKDPKARVEYYRKYRKTERGRAIVNKGNKKWLAKNPERALAASEAWRKKNQAKVTAQARVRTYGVVPPQPNVCDACAQPWGTRRLRPVIDHDHATGEVRGWLHHGCNVALGFAGEDARTLKLLANYADKWAMLR